MARLRLFAHVAAVGTAAAALLTVVSVTPASACSCFPEGEGAKYQRAQHVFTGTVVDLTVEQGDPSVPYDDMHRYTVQVHHEYKGDVPRKVHVVTHSQGATCGIRLNHGTQYLIFAFGDSSDHRVETNLCSGTRLASGGPPITTTPTPTTTPTSMPTSTCTTAPAP